MSDTFDGVGVRQCFCVCVCACVCVCVRACVSVCSFVVLLDYAAEIEASGEN